MEKRMLICSEFAYNQKNKIFDLHAKNTKSQIELLENIGI